MEKLRSCDKTMLAYDVYGEGPALILIDGWLNSRSVGNSAQLAELLSTDFTVYHYDRRGCGESGDSVKYTVSKEINDLKSLIKLAGGTAFLYGHSSGAVLALEAALALGEAVPRLVAYETPLNDDENARQKWAAYRADLEKLSKSRSADAILARFLAATGMSEDSIAEVRATPQWKTLRRFSKSLIYNAELMGHDGSIPLERFAGVKSRALFLGGETSWPYTCETAMKLAEALPDAYSECIPSQGHIPDPAVLAPILKEFFTEK